MGSEQVNLISRQYNKCSLWVVAAATLATLLAINVYDAQQEDFKIYVRVNDNWEQWHGMELD